ncbi:MAG TPA: glycosyltransferase family 4 protein [Herbaspirillum sp.]|nr:glycosyltransferase family 4 protein [Herbaspirillum sp.]
MKILLLNDEFYTTGASIAMLRLAERLVQQHEVSVMSRLKGEGEIKKQFQALGVPIVDNVQEADLVIANTLMCGAHVAQAAVKCPVIWWIHETEIGRDMLLLFPQLAAGFKHATQIVFQTEYQKKVYGSFLFDSPADVQVLPFWNDAIYKRDPVEQAPKQKKRIVCIGTIEPRKRMEDTIQAVDLLDKKIKDEVEVVIIGKYLEMKSGIKTLAQAHPERYRFMGEQSNDATLAQLASADAFVLASGSESQPLTIWEAFELDVPVCLSDLETYRHIGLYHGRNALMHPVGNVEMLSVNLHMLLTSNTVRSSITRAAKSLLLKHLSHDWSEEFERIIGRVATRWEIKKLGY